MHPHPRFYRVVDFNLKSKPPFYFFTPQTFAEPRDTMVNLKGRTAMRRCAHTSFVLTIRMVAQAKRARL